MGGEDEAAVALLADTTVLWVKQEVAMWEAISAGVLEQQNIYRITDENEQPLYVARERSTCFNRCCCNPNHSLVVELASERDKNVFYSFERQGCCTAKPFLPCMPCTSMCSDEMIMHQGLMEGEPGSIVNPSPVYTITQASTCEACIFPRIDIKSVDGDGPIEDKTPEFTVHGSCCFGGWSELCMNNSYEVRNREGTRVGEVKKRRPDDCMSMLSECCTDSDRYKVSYEDQSLKPKTKAAILGAAFLVDYMFFEKDLGLCTMNNDGVGCTCFNCYCGGCIIPCTIWLPKGKSDE